MNKRSDIEAILSSEKIAVAGVSRNKHKFGSIVFRDLLSKGYKAVAVNPNMDEIDGTTCYKTIAELPPDVDALICVTKPEVTTLLVNEAKRKGINNIWFQQGAESSESLAFCDENGIVSVSGACIMMYAEPVKSFHKVHKGFAKVFGKYIN